MIEWTYTKEQQKYMRKLDKAKEKYATEIKNIISEQPKKHHQLLVFDACNVELQIYFTITDYNVKNRCLK